MMQTIKGLSAPVAVWVAALLLAGCAGFPTTAEQVDLDDVEDLEGATRRPGSR